MNALRVIEPLKQVGIKFHENPNAEHRFSISKIYSFLTNLELRGNDWVVVDTQYGYTVGYVATPPYFKNTIKGVNANKWVIQKVDLEAHRKRVLEDAKRAEVMEQIHTRMKEIREEEIIKEMATKHPDLQKLLEEYAAIGQEEVIDAQS